MSDFLIENVRLIDASCGLDQHGALLVRRGVIADIGAGIDAVTPADIAALGRSLLAPGRATVSVLGPKGAMDAARRFDAAIAG